MQIADSSICTDHKVLRGITIIIITTATLFIFIIIASRTRWGIKLCFYFTAMFSLVVTVGSQRRHHLHPAEEEGRREGLLEGGRGGGDVIGRPGRSLTHPEQKQLVSLPPADWTQRGFGCFFFLLFAVIVCLLFLLHCCVHCWIVELGTAAKDSLLLLLSLFFVVDGFRCSPCC